MKFSKLAAALLLLSAFATPQTSVRLLGSGPNGFTYISSDANGNLATTTASSTPAGVDNSYYPAVRLQGLGPSGFVYLQTDSFGNLKISGGGGIQPLAFGVSSGYNLCFGDSTMRGFNATSYLTSLCGKMAQDLLGTTVNYGKDGDDMRSIALKIMTYAPNPQVGNATGILTKLFVNGGINDANNSGASAGFINHYKLGLSAAAGYALQNVKQYAFLSTKFGSWVQDNSANTSLQNGAKSTANGDTIFFGSTPTGGFIGLTWLAQPAANTGTFQVSIDGVNQTFVCTGTTTFNSANCGSGYNFTAMYRQAFAVTPNVSHQLVVTTVSASAGSPVIIEYYDADGSSTAGQNIFMMSGVIPQQGDNISATTAAYNTAAQAEVTALQAENMNIYFVNVRNGTTGFIGPGVNSTTDFGGGGCPAGSSLHPGDCGYLHWAQTFENTATADGLNLFFAGFGHPGDTGYFGTNVLNTTPSTGMGSTGFGFTANGSTNNTGTISLRPSGTGIVANSPLVMTQWLSTPTAPSFCYLTPIDATSKTLWAGGNIYADTYTANGFTVEVGSTALTTGASYNFGYFCSYPPA